MFLYVNFDCLLIHNVTFISLLLNNIGILRGETNVIVMLSESVCDPGLGVNYTYQKQNWLIINGDLKMFIHVYKYIFYHCEQSQLG